jgi:uncharacterized membrane protein
MSRSTARIVVVFAAWTIFVWVTRIRNVLGDDERTTSFKVVHSVIALISVGLAVAALLAVRRERTAGTGR